MTESPLTIVQAARQFREGRLTPTELVRRCIDRIAQYEERVRAWVLVDVEGALREAELLTASLRDGHDLGPMHGIPIAVKDIFDVAGMPTRAGSPFTSQEPVAEDAPVVARLRRGGAIILGKTVTTQFASFDPPVTRNPWNLSHTPGGSSSGSAAAVALGMCVAAFGSQTGGSITRPATYCGVAGIKPTYRTLPVTGVVPLAWSLDHVGWLAPCVQDLAFCLGASISSKPPKRWEVYLGQQGYEEGAGPPEGHWGVIRGFFYDEADEEVRRVTDEALDRLRADGATFELVEPPVDFHEVIRSHRLIMAVEAAAYHRHDFPAREREYGERFAALMHEGLAASAVQYAAALEHQHQFRRTMARFVRQFDAVVMPATSTPAPDASTTGNPLFNSPWSYSWLPVVSHACGLSSDGMPVGLQWISPPYDEEGALAAADWAESQLGFKIAPPLKTG